MSALQNRSPIRKNVAKAAARHPRPALLHGSARRKATGEHFPPGVSAVHRESATKCYHIKLQRGPGDDHSVYMKCGELNTACNKLLNASPTFRFEGSYTNLLLMKRLSLSIDGSLGDLAGAV